MRKYTLVWEDSKRPAASGEPSTGVDVGVARRRSGRTKSIADRPIAERASRAMRGEPSTGVDVGVARRRSGRTKSIAEPPIAERASRAMRGEPSTGV
ncbi:MAG: hypothetical protein IKX88_06130, partial [Thermoguttaceae bacterium]|nr:hypothetical protein [Thermoguttaceae bacterium]